ncbi:N-acetyl-gamma-glutamyl-phosphate reductase [Prolixibacter denitrificans]|uniref:N-acetyl-gamma-glutamyl-phosphate reductase n=1 Tax=Prolixibacter denitrificans TaxID=1541063 RepID=A0A2P8CEF3_9BACT|nr:N-acetyl-gamma-glutamyl-phosphate reductase [Prolixibacter denitrificans]PSK83357.1 N-acetyl-gamma-glutamyl-phosphate reductase [Prolixibacter denitrificans]GET21762.1 N-acetyl-gamma-glutamyl-phosphate reductase [Prolixibacter denitrificans]
MGKKKIGIIGATGYTGSELVRILVNHPEVEIALITSESRAGEKFSDIHTSFRGIVDIVLQPASQVEKTDLDLVFLALPHGVSMDFVKKYHQKPFKIVDLSGDFRLDSPEVYHEWYQKEHVYHEGFDSAVFGLPELNRENIKQSELVANPGCFPTTAILGLAPLLSEGLVESRGIIVDSKTGVTGAGVKPKEVTHFPNVNDNFKAYGLKKHRHTIEIQDTLNKLSSEEVSLQFTPHLLPVDRGILSTIYARPVKELTTADLNALYLRYYEGHPFVRITPEAPSIKDVRASNYCNIFITFDERTGNIIVLSAIDNLVKGAAGQAIQNMNLMLGLDETTGLKQVPVNP